MNPPRPHSPAQPSRRRWRCSARASANSPCSATSRSCENPANVDALYYVALIAIQEGQFAEGLKVIARAFAVGPPQARLHNLKGQAHLRQNQDEDALQGFGRAIECEPAFADAYGNRGSLLADMGRAAEALAAFDRALALRPDNPRTFNRATVLADLGRLDAALDGFSRAIALSRPWRRPTSTAPRC